PRRVDPLAQVRVGDVMVRQVVTLNPDLGCLDLVEEFGQHPYSSLPVVDGGHQLQAVVGYSELRDVLTLAPSKDGLSARDLMRTPPPVCHPDDTLSDVTEKFRLANLGRLPVVRREDPTRLVGVISHSDVLSAYERLVLRRGDVDTDPPAARGDP